VSRQLDEEQDVDALQEQRGDGQEVTLEDARRLLREELRPARLQPIRRRLDLRIRADRPDRARRQRDPEPRPARLGSAASPRLGSPAPVGRRARESRRQSQAGPDGDADTSSCARFDVQRRTTWLGESGRRSLCDRERGCDEVSEDGDQADGVAAAGAPRPNCAKGPKTDVIAATATPHCGK
jgi:hypothetical protein